MRKKVAPPQQWSALEHFSVKLVDFKYEQEQMPRDLQDAFIHQPPPPGSCFCKRFQHDSLAAAFKEMVNNPHLSDVQFQVDSGELIYAHKFVLYARCPQLLQFVDHTSFVVAENGDVGARRVLLHDTPGEAVTSFLNYLYAAEDSIPEPLLLDVADLAIRFGVKDLAAPGEGPSEEAAAGDGRGAAETFEQLLKSVWPDEGKNPELKSVSGGGLTSERMDEQELEEIYETVATQQQRALGGVEEDSACTEEGHDEGEIELGGPGKELEARKEGKRKRDLEPSGWELSREEGLSELPTEFQQDVKEMMLLEATPGEREALPRLSGASGQRNHQERPGSPWRPFSFTEGELSFREPSIDSVRKETTLRNFLSPSRDPRKDLQTTFSSDLQAHVTRSLLPPTSQPRRLFFQGFKQEQIKREGEVPTSSPEEPAGLSNPLHSYVVVLDSDEELEQGAAKKQEASASDASRHPSQGTVASPASEVFSGCDWLGELVCQKAQPGGRGQELWDPERPEEAWSEGGSLLVPDTPLSARKGLKQTTASQRHSGLEQGGVCESLARPLSGSSSSPSSLETDHNPRTAEGDVVVVGDSEEEEEATGPPFPGVSFAEPFVTVAVNAGNPEGSSVRRSDERQGHPPVAVSIASTAMMVHFGGADSPLQSSQNWAREESDNEEACLLAQRLPALGPDLASQSRESPSIPPQMPSPSYSAMGTPLLKKELRRFGVRALPKRQMVLKLKEIFQFTHQARKEAMPVAARSPRKLQRKFVSPCPSLPGSQTIKGFTDTSGAVNWKMCSSEPEFGWMKGADRLPVGGSTEGVILTASQESPGSSSASRESSVASQSSSAESAMAEKETPRASQDAACEVQKVDILQQYFYSNPSLCQQILLYQPVELSVLHAGLKQNGVRIALDKLLDFLDANCITFTTAEARRERKQQFHRSKKKERRRR